MAGVRLYLGDCATILPAIPDASVDCVITDPPYPEIDRDYGRMTEAEWFAMMRVVVPETRRILKPTGSAVFILQPNSERVGRMRTWLWEFMAWVGKKWGIVQDAYWWNYTTLPAAGATIKGLMRGSVKPCVWMGPADCYRAQEAVLWSEAEGNIAQRARARMRRDYFPSGNSVNRKVISDAAAKRGGVTPFNVLPIPNADSTTSAGAHGHGAGTPFALCDWWVRYICPPGGVVADWFMGSGTTGLAALKHGCSFVGIEKMPKYYDIAQRRIEVGHADR